MEVGNLAGLRTFRVLRALKTVSIMPGEDQLKFTKKILLMVLTSRSQDHHKCATTLVQTIGGGHDANDFLSHGLRTVRATGVQGGIEE